MIKDAHISAVEHLKNIGYPSKDIETSFKEESNKRKSEVYEVYSKFVER